MWRLLVVLLVATLSSVAVAAPKPCSFMMQYAHADGFSNILVCNGKRHQGISVRVESDGTLTGIYWTEHQGDKERNFQMYQDGTIAFVVVDNAIQGGFSKKSRVTQYQLLPRGNRMSIDGVPDGLLVHDAAGHTWHLVESQFGEYDTSYVVASIQRVRQTSAPIKFTEVGLVGIDLAAAGVFYLQHKQPTFGGYTSRATRAYREMKSIFHDERGATCAVPNSKVMVPNPKDPKDVTDMAFGFTDDAALATFLEKECPKLDLSPLSQVLETR